MWFKSKKNISFFLLDAPLTSLLVDPEKTLYTHMLGKKNGFPNEFGMVFVEFTSADFMGIYDGIRNLYVC